MQVRLGWRKKRKSASVESLYSMLRYRQYSVRPWRIRFVRRAQVTGLRPDSHGRLISTPMLRDYLDCDG